MKIPFEKWIEDNSIPEEAKELFAESIICYKISAYRSAFIMSYIAFQNILKQRILDTPNIPEEINPNCWKKICSALGDEDEWDKEVAECVKRTKPNNIFLISPSIVREYEAYRVIRNKCAHGKSGKIEYYHIESLWNFIQENFYKFVVNGGKTGVMQQIEDYYDRTITPLGTDIQPIVNNIKFGVQDAELDDLLKDIYSFGTENSSFYVSQFEGNSKFVGLWDGLVNKSDMRIRNAVIKFVKEQECDSICSFVGRYPSTADEFLSDEAFARKLWTRVLFNCKYNESGFWNLLEKIILRNMVPDVEKKDFNKSLFKRIGKNIPSEHKKILEKTDYFSKLREVLLSVFNYKHSDGINFANANCHQFVKFIKVCGLDKDSVRCINQIFSFATFGMFYDEIKKLMKQEDYLEQYESIVTENSMENYKSEFVSE